MANRRGGLQGWRASMQGRIDDAFSKTRVLHRRHHWLNQLYAVIAGYTAAALIILIYAKFTPLQAKRGWMVVTEYGVLLFLVPLLYFLRHRVVDSPYRTRVFYFLTACSFPMIGWVWYLDGGTGSPTTWQFF